MSIDLFLKIDGICPKYFKLQEGGDAGNPQSLTAVNDWGERGKPTHMQLEV